MSSRPTSRLWYRAPAEMWVESLPVGNGRLGAMVPGKFDVERLQLNEETVWSGGPQDADNPVALEALPKVRELLFAGRYQQAQDLADESLVCAPDGESSFGCYQTLGDLVLEFPAADEPEEYQRELVLDEAVARVLYRRGTVTFRREVFASAPDQVLVIRLTATRPRSVGLAVSLTRSELAQTVAKGPDELSMEGQLDHHRGAGDGMRFCALVRARIDGGICRVQHDSLCIDAADAVTLLVAAATDYRGGAWRQRVVEQLEEAAVQSYEELLSRHIAEHCSRFDRVQIDLGESSASELATDERLAAHAAGVSDPALYALFFQFGRYLLLASSRPGCMAANLQGIWAEGVQPPWNCDYHTNINVQMNYWLAEPGNLAECVDPLIDLVEAMRVPGSKTARIHYGAPGWVVHTIHNVWGFTSPGSRPLWGLSPLAGAWLCQHLFEHYAFSGDSNVLRRVYPTLKHAAEFCVNWVVEDPHRKVLVSGPATSPENTFITPEGDHCSVSMGPAMDQQILWEHLSNVALAAEILGDKDPLIERVREARDRLAGPEIGADGRLMEWSQPFAEAEPEHRHVSHLFALHPGKQITPRASPDLAEAARRSLSARGDGGTGWSMAWKICFWARLGDGDRALALLDHLLKPVGFGGGQHRDDSAGVYRNLFCAHPPFQIDGNLGGPAGIAEMLLQSHEDVLDVLPALPSSWQSGSVKGLRARGGFVVDLSWELGVLRSAVVTATRPGPCWIHYRGATVAFDIGAGDSRDVGPLLRQATPRASCPI